MVADVWNPWPVQYGYSHGCHFGGDVVPINDGQCLSCFEHEADYSWSMRIEPFSGRRYTGPLTQCRCTFVDLATIGPYYVAGEAIRSNLIDGETGKLPLQIVQCPDPDCIFRLSQAFLSMPSSRWSTLILVARSLALRSVSSTPDSTIRDHISHIRTIDIWSCNSTGEYGGFVTTDKAPYDTTKYNGLIQHVGDKNDAGVTITDSLTRLRGQQLTNSNGIAQFTTLGQLDSRDSSLW